MSQYGGTRSIENIAAHGGWVGTTVDPGEVCFVFLTTLRVIDYRLLRSRRYLPTHAFGNVAADSTAHYGCG